MRFSTCLIFLTIFISAILQIASAHTCVPTNGGVETCDGIDNNCNGLTDEGLYGCNIYLDQVAPHVPNGASSDLIDDANGIAFYDRFIYASDSASHVIRQIDPIRGSSVILAGSLGNPGMADGTGSNALFDTPQALAFAKSTGLLFVVDQGNDAIRALNVTSGAVWTVAGNGTAGSQDGKALAATFDNIMGILVSNNGRTILVADNGNNKIRKIRDGVVSTFAGTGAQGNQDGLCTSGATLNGPVGMTEDSLGNIYFSEDSHDIRMISFPNGTCTVSLFAGSPGNSGTSVGPALGASCFNNPQGLGVDFQDNIYVADSNNGQIRVVYQSSGNVAVYSTNAPTLQYPTSVAVHVQATGPYPVLYIGDQGAQNVLYSYGKKERKKIWLKAKKNLNKTK